MTDTPTVPGKGWYVAAGAIAVTTVFAIVALIAWFVLTLDRGEQFLGPGRHTAAFDKPGTYLVWNDYRTVFHGRSYDETETLPSGVQITVRELDSGNALAVSASLGASSNLGDTARNSVAQFEIARPGRYEIIVEGDFPQRVFSASREFLFGLIALIFGAIGLLFAGFGAAIGILCWVFIKREEAREAIARAAAPAGVHRPAGTHLAAGMHPPAGAPSRTDTSTQSLKDITRIVYILQLASLAVGVTFIAAVIVNYVKRKDVEGTWLESHFRWQIRTFWYCLLWTCIGLATAVLVIGFFVLMATLVWMLYRAIKGLLNLEENKPMAD
jgi:uncharacterized membrane protein